MRMEDKTSRELIAAIIQKVQLLLVVLTLSVVAIFSSVLILIAFPDAAKSFSFFHNLIITNN